LTAKYSRTNTVGPAAETHDRMAAGYQAQRDRFAPPGDMWSGAAGNFKADLSAPLDSALKTIASFLGAGDTLLDVGGGAGGLSLPLAGSCRQVICIDPSPAMGEIFVSTVRDAGIENARFIAGDWLDVETDGDVTLVAHVTYFVRSVVPFIDKLNRATRRRVLLVVRSAPPPNQLAPFVRLARGEELARVPGPDELRAVLDEMGIAHELIDTGPAPAPVMMPVAANREDAVRIEVEGGKRLGWIRPEESDRCTELFLDHFDELFVQTPQGLRRRSGIDAHELIITWESRR
jgi:2-polyprenyl-3-methyl-5-hydroxy-6-metoxy-1,4-benzoquinol methylase